MIFVSGFSFELSFIWDAMFQWMSTYLLRGRGAIVIYVPSEAKLIFVKLEVRFRTKSACVTRFTQRFVCFI